MVHPALLRFPVPTALAAGRPRTKRSGWVPSEAAKHLFRRLNQSLASGYRPERHYMRGGRTAGAKSLAAG